MTDSPFTPAFNEEDAEVLEATPVENAEDAAAEVDIVAEEDAADAPAAEEGDVEAEAASSADVESGAEKIADVAAEAEEEDAVDRLNAFASLGLSRDAMIAVEKLGYESPTPVQQQAIPIVLMGRDLIAAASTGTGKTAAFLLPLLSNLPRAGRGKRPPRVLVVTPTRELAQQIAFTCIKIARATGHFATTVYGGTPYGPQIRELRGGTDILIATPGRLNDLMERGVVDLSHIEALVLDEADRMLDMGFLPDVTTIVEALPTDRQTLLFSATIDQSIENNLGSLLNNPAIVQIAHRGETAKTVDQYIMPIAHKAKFELLEAVLSEKGHERVIVFARTKIRAEEVAEELVDAGYKAESIHSDKSQGRRRRALENFRKGKTDILVATDVLARGIDVTGVDYVINYDLPDMPEDYVHRIGRTGRAGERGFAISFVSPNSRKLLREIEKLIDRDIPVMELEGYDLDLSILAKGGKKEKRSRKDRVRSKRDRRDRPGRDPLVEQARHEKDDDGFATAGERRHGDRKRGGRRDDRHGEANAKRNDRFGKKSESRGEEASWKNSRKDRRERTFGADGAERYEKSSRGGKKGFGGKGKRDDFGDRSFDKHGRGSRSEGGFGKKRFQDDRGRGGKDTRARRGSDRFDERADRRGKGGRFGGSRDDRFGKGGDRREGKKTSLRSKGGRDHRGAKSRFGEGAGKPGKPQKHTRGKGSAPRKNGVRAFGERKLRGGGYTEIK